MTFEFNLMNPLNQIPMGTFMRFPVIVREENHYNDMTGFAIYTVENELEENFKIKGVVVERLKINCTYFIEGNVSEYLGERQFTFKKASLSKPVNKKGTIAYLQTINGLKTKAELIYEEFGEESIEILISNPTEVSNRIRGVGKKSVIKWQEQLKALKGTQDIITILLGYGLTIKQARKLHELYKEDVVARIEENPYRLAYEVEGYGYERCDKIARNMGFDPKSFFRVKEAILHALYQSQQNGHCFLPIEELIQITKDIVTVRLTISDINQVVSQHPLTMESPETIDYQLGGWVFNLPLHEIHGIYRAYLSDSRRYKKEFEGYVLVNFSEYTFTKEINYLIENKIVVNLDGAMYLTRLFKSEYKVAHLINELNQTIPFRRPLDLEEELEEYCTENNLQLEERQREAALTFAKEKGGIYVLTGSAGCGKSFTLRIILEMIERQYRANKEPCKIQLFAPTGKASKIVEKSTGRECSTVHRGLGYSPEGFTFNEEDPLDINVAVVDETSMLDILLAGSFLEAIERGTKIIFLGDTQQLPSVGPGNVLKDIIESDVVKVVKLNVVKRQGAFSSILLNANNIIDGLMIKDYPDKKDSFIINRGNATEVLNYIIKSYERLLQKDYQHEDIQIISPQKKGLVGTNMLNYALQRQYCPDVEGEIKVLNKRFDIQFENNPKPTELELYFKQGDKVIHLKNNKETKWYILENGKMKIDDSTVGITNGECGVIADIYKNGNNTVIWVNYEGKYVAYRGDSFSELEHAWALTIHKSQGSQWKALILPIVDQHYNMLDNNLFYTAYTRAELFNVVIGQPSAIKRAITTYKTRTRYTSLAMLIQYFKERKEQQIL